MYLTELNKEKYRIKINRLCFEFLFLLQSFFNALWISSEFVLFSWIAVFLRGIYFRAIFILSCIYVSHALSNCLFKVNNKNNGKPHGICSKLTLNIFHTFSCFYFFL